MSRGRPIRASAPGSIMVTGEHAVVYGHRAIVAAVNQRVEVTLTPRADQRLSVRSQIAPALECDLTDPPQDGPYRFVLAALAIYRPQMENGFDMEISSDIDPTLGLGSSAAVTVACLGAFHRFAMQTQGKPTEDPPCAKLHLEALSVVRAIQGRGSGADLAASLYGGLIAYKAPENSNAAQVSHLHAPDAAMSLKNCGYKTPTSEVLRRVAERRVGQEAAFDALYARMGQSADAAIAAAEAEDWAAFFGALKGYQALMAALGVSDDTLDGISAEAYGSPETLAAKISGSGLGDCVLAFGPPPPGFEPVALTKKGLCLDG